MRFQLKLSLVTIFYLRLEPVKLLLPNGLIWACPLIGNYGHSKPHFYDTQSKAYVISRNIERYLLKQAVPT